jgi:hypothetical protein
MRTRIMELLLPTLVQAMVNSFGEEYVKYNLDKFLDTIEDRIAASETKVDDALLPLLKAVRNIFDIPDNDEDPQRS